MVTYHFLKRKEFRDSEYLIYLVYKNNLANKHLDKIPESDDNSSHSFASWITDSNKNSLF